MKQVHLNVKKHLKYFFVSNTTSSKHYATCSYKFVAFLHLYNNRAVILSSVYKNIFVLKNLNPSNSAR